MYFVNLSICLGSLSILRSHESDADPILQFTCTQNISTAGWCKFVGTEIKGSEKLTLVDHEYKIRSQNIIPAENIQIIPKPLVMGFDIEVNSHNPSAMPNKTHPKDCVFQISCVFCRSGDDPDTYTKYLLSLGDPDQKVTGEQTIIKRFKSEGALIDGFAELIRELNPNVISGYNILGFDIPI